MRLKQRLISVFFLQINFFSIRKEFVALSFVSHMKLASFVCADGLFVSLFQRGSPCMFFTITHHQRKVCSRIVPEIKSFAVCFIYIPLRSIHLFYPGNRDHNDVYVKLWSIIN